MNNFIIECPHPLKITDIRTHRSRLTTPRPGDVVDLVLFMGRYPANRGRFGTIESVSKDKIHFCLEPGSIHISHPDHASISGGPFSTVPKASMIPAWSVIYYPDKDHPHLRRQTIWNWGTNRPGAGNAVFFEVDRPIFIATKLGGYRDDEAHAYHSSCGLTEDQWNQIKAAVDAHLQTA